MSGFDRITDSQLGDIRIAASKLMLETDGITNQPTETARAMALVNSALKELTALSAQRHKP